MPVSYSWPLIDTVTGNAIIDSVRRRGMLPTTGSLSDDDILELADEELLTYVLPLLISEDVGDHLVAVYDDTTVVGQDRYLIPDDAAVSKLRDLQILEGTTYCSLEYVEPEAPEPGNQCFTFEGEYVVLRPTPTTATTLRFKYYRRPGSLVTKEEAGRITDITGLDVTVTPAALFGASTTSTVDIVRGRPGFGTLGRNVDVAVDGTGAILTFPDADSLVGISLGDYVCNQGEAPFPQIPKELHPLLIQRVVVRCLEALGDPKFQASKILCDEMAAKAVEFLTPRNDGTGRVVINRNGPGWGRWGRRGYRF